MDNWTATEGSPSPLGVTWIEDEQAYNFALYSKHATGVTLLLFAEADQLTPVFQYRHDFLSNKSGRVWHCRVPERHLGGARYYGYCVEGPFNPAEGHRFDPQKLLLDPSARAVVFPTNFSRSAACEAGSNIGRAPLGLIQTNHCSFDWSRDKRPRHTHDTVIYEMHVKGFTMRTNSGVSAEKRGTYAGVVEKIPYLKALGITAVELLPIYQYDPDEGNYWGYMPLNFFFPHHGYASDKKPGRQIL